MGFAEAVTCLLDLIHVLGDAWCAGGLGHDHRLTLANDNDSMDTLRKFMRISKVVYRPIKSVFLAEPKLDPNQYPATLPKMPEMMVATTMLLTSGVKSAVVST